MSAVTPQGAMATPARMRRPAAACLTHDRLDLVVKHDFFAGLLANATNSPARRTGEAEERYRRHILGRTGGFEGEKRSVDDYVASARTLLERLRREGFDPAHPVRIGAANGRPLDGAHRIAAALALGCDVTLEEVQGGYGGVWNFDWFRENGFSSGDLDWLLRRYAALAPAPVVFVFWGPCRERWPRLLAALGEMLPVVGWMDVRVARDALPVLVDDVYAWRLGPLRNARIQAKGDLLASTGPAVCRVVLCDARGGDATALAKRRLRAIAGRDELDFAATVHASDDAEEARYLTSLFFSANYRRHLEARGRAPLRPQFEAWLANYASVLDGNGIAREDACVVGSAVLEIVGVRTATDIDCIVGRREPRFHAGVTSLGAGVDLVTRGYHRRADGGPTWNDAEVVEDPALHFHVRGVKVANPELVIDRKRQHARPKDLADVALWERHIARLRTKVPERAASSPAAVVAWRQHPPDVLAYSRLEQDAERMRQEGRELVLAGVEESPVGATFPVVLRPPHAASLAWDPSSSAGDALEWLRTAGVDASHVLEQIAAESGPAEHPGITRRRLAALAWIARWMEGWLAELRPCAVHVYGDGPVEHLLAAVWARCQARRIAADASDSVDVRAAVRFANDAVLLLRRAVHADAGIGSPAPDRHVVPGTAPRSSHLAADRPRAGTCAGHHACGGLEEAAGALEAARQEREAWQSRAHLLWWVSRSSTLSIWIWGAGAAGRQAIDWLRAHHVVPAGVIDSDPARAGALIDGLQVHTPEALVPRAPGQRVLIASVYAAEIRGRLLALGIAGKHVLEWEAALWETEIA